MSSYLFLANEGHSSSLIFFNLSKTYTATNYLEALCEKWSIHHNVTKTDFTSFLRIQCKKFAISCVLYDIAKNCLSQKKWTNTIEFKRWSTYYLYWWSHVAKYLSSYILSCFLTKSKFLCTGHWCTFKGWARVFQSYCWHWFHKEQWVDRLDYIASNLFFGS